MSKKDLFDDSTMTFGEHLEVLRYHLWRAILGLVIGSVAAFFFSNHIIVAIQKPVIEAMDEVFSNPGVDKIEKSKWEAVKDWYSTTFGKSGAKNDAAGPANAVNKKPIDPGMVIEF